MVSLVILGIMGTAMLRLFVSQSRFVEQAATQRSARTVSRASLNFLMSEMRAVEATGGAVAASPTSVTLRPAFALGMSCGTVGGATTVSLLPADSSQFAGAVFSGYAWRDSRGVYTYVESGAAISPAPASACDAAGIVTLPRGRVVSVTPPIAPPDDAGTAVVLFERVRYEFAASRLLPGRLALWRTPSNGAAEEIAAPFDPSSSSFGFHRVGSDTAESTPPASLADLRGLELRLAGASERPRRGRTQPEVAVQRSAVFFLNRPE